MPRRNLGYRLEKQKTGIWWLVWYEKQRLHSVSTRQTDQIEAVKFMHGYLTEDVRVPQNFLTVKHALDDYEAEHVERKVVAKERFKFARMSLKPLEHHTIQDLTDSHLNYWRARRHVGDGTIRRELGVLKAAIRHEVKRKRLSESQVPWIEMPERPPSKDRVLSREEISLLMQESRYTGIQGSDGKFTLEIPKKLSRMRRFMMLAYWTGARRASLEQLRWSQVDLVTKKINLNAPGRRQTAKRRPVVPIFDELLPTLVRAKVEATTPFVLDHQGSCYKSFVRLCGLENVTPHTIRHSWATHRAQDGIDLYAIAGVLGDDVRTVTENYLHHCPEHLRQAFAGKIKGGAEG